VFGILQIVVTCSGMIPALDAETGYLPPGRFSCTESEIASRFVESEQFSDSKTRQEIWEHWTSVRQFVIDRIPVYRVWFGGSFVGSKLDPDDLDVLWTWDAEAFEQLSTPDQQILVPFAQGRDGLARFGLKIDSYALFWRCFPAPTTHQIHLDPYFRSRGYWDDFWMRARTGPKEDPPKPEDAYPRRGYLEVAYRDHG
jgi:hypothetical protein